MNCSLDFQTAIMRAMKLTQTSVSKGFSFRRFPKFAAIWLEYHSACTNVRPRRPLGCKYSLEDSIELFKLRLQLRKLLLYQSLFCVVKELLVYNMNILHILSGQVTTSLGPSASVDKRCRKRQNCTSYVGVFLFQHSSLAICSRQTVQLSLISMQRSRATQTEYISL